MIVSTILFYLIQPRVVVPIFAKNLLRVKSRLFAILSFYATDDDVVVHYEINQSGGQTGDFIQVGELIICSSLS